MGADAAADASPPVAAPGAPRARGCCRGAGAAVGPAPRGQTRLQPSSISVRPRHAQRAQEKLLRLAVPPPGLKPRLRPNPLPPQTRRTHRATPRAPPTAVDCAAGFDLRLVAARPTDRTSSGRDGEEAGAAAGARGGGAVGAALAVGQDGLLPRLHARLAAPRLRAAAAHRPPRPAPPARAPLQLPPRPPRLRTHPPRPGQGLPLPLLPRRPPRRLRRPLPAHPLRVHGVRGRRGLPVGGGGVQRRLPLLRARQGRRGLRRGRRRRRRARAPRQGPARRRRGHVPDVARARRRAPRHGLPGEQPREAPAPRRLPDRHRSSEAKGNPHAQVAEAMHCMTPDPWSYSPRWKRVLKRRQDSRCFLLRSQILARAVVVWTPHATCICYPHRRLSLSLALSQVDIAWGSAVNMVVHLCFGLLQPRMSRAADAIAVFSLYSSSSSVSSLDVTGPEL